MSVAAPVKVQGPSEPKAPPPPETIPPAPDFGRHLPPPAEPAPAPAPSRSPLDVVTSVAGDAFGSLGRALPIGGPAIDPVIDRVAPLVEHGLGELGEGLDDLRGRADELIDDGREAVGGLVDDLAQGTETARAVVDAAGTVGRELLGRGLDLAGQGLRRAVGVIGDVTGISDTIDQIETGMNAIADPRDEIAQLNSDGDQVLFEITHEGKLTIPFPRAPQIGVGGKGQYGSQITITQNGGADPNAPVTPGAVPPADSYTITFDRNLQGGAVADAKPGPGELGAEANLRTADSVTFEVDTPEDAARVAETLRDLALSDQVRDYGNVLTPTPLSLLPGIGPLASLGSNLPDFLSNPFVNGGSTGLPSVPTLPELVGLPSAGDAIADRFAPSEQDLQFLDRHVTGYSQRIGLQERGRLGAQLGAFGLEGRVDLNGDIIRTVELPRDGQPGRVTYAGSAEIATSLKERARLGASPLGVPSTISPQALADLTRDGVQLEIGYELPAGTEVPSFLGRPVPERELFRDGLPAPDSISLRAESVRPTELPLPTTGRIDQSRSGVDITVADPGQNLGAALEGLFGGDRSALAAAGENLTVTRYDEQVRRDGVFVQPEIGVSPTTVDPSGRADDRVNFEAKTSLIIEAGVDDIVSRETTTVDGLDLAGVAPPAVTPPAPTPPEQQVVVPLDGVNLRDAPTLAGDRIGALQHGEFLQPTGRRQTDPTGRDWTEVTGRDDRNRELTGWVASENLATHPEGAVDETGRVNSDLAPPAVRSHVIAPGETLWDLSGRDGERFRELLQLNEPHLIERGMLFPGDTVYLPGRPGN